MSGPEHLSHPFALLRFARDAVGGGQPVALVFVTQTRGGSVRLPGLRMVVDAAGRWAGNVSNGCLESDVARRALSAIATGRAATASYGGPQDPIDLRLPCGGMVELLIVPQADGALLDTLVAAAEQRQPVCLDVSPGGHIANVVGAAPAGPGWRFHLDPPIHLVVAGVGAETLALARLARAIDLAVTVVSSSPELVDAAQAAGAKATLLKGLGSSPALDLDRFTAVAILFHDHEWEFAPLNAALASEAFYIGAMGSARVADHRRAVLRDRFGHGDAQLDRIKAPIGLIQHLHDPESLAVSVLAQVVADYRELCAAPPLAAVSHQ